MRPLIPIERYEKIIKTAFLLVLIGISGFAQQKDTLDDESNWVRFESPAPDFSFSLPRTGYLVDNEDGAFRLHYLSGQITIKIDMTPTSSAKDNFKRSYYFEKEKNYQFAEISDFLVGQFIGENTKENLNLFWLHLASSKGQYLIAASSKEASDLVFRRFIDSIRLNGKAIYIPQKKYPVEPQTNSVSTLKTDAIILQALRKPDSKQKRPEKVKDLDNENKVDKNVYSRQLVLLRKPKVNIGATSGVVSGIVKLKVTFLANGEVGNVVLLQSSESGFIMSAFNAAKKIKFLPAEIDGKPVDVTKIIEYSFTIYGFSREGLIN